MLVAFLLIITVIAIVGVIVAAYYAIEPKRRMLEEQQREQEARSIELMRKRGEIDQKDKALTEEIARVDDLRKQLSVKVISYQELQNENAILKRDLSNLDVNLRKLRLDEQLRQQTQERLDEKVNQLVSWSPKTGPPIKL